MPDVHPLQGELQSQVMAVIWRIDAGTVEQVRSALPARYRSGYTTIQTVLNRLVDRGLLAREKVGRGMVYSAKLSEEEYVSRSIKGMLAGASATARQTVLANLVGALDKSEITELQRLAKQADRQRKKRP